jgi:hypothetical protein
MSNVFDIKSCASIKIPNSSLFCADGTKQPNSVISEAINNIYKKFALGKQWSIHAVLNIQGGDAMHVPLEDREDINTPEDVIEAFFILKEIFPEESKYLDLCVWFPIDSPEDHIRLRSAKRCGKVA